MRTERGGVSGAVIQDRIANRRGISMGQAKVEILARAGIAITNS